jgi:uncharacterized membrane protein YkoI
MTFKRKAALIAATTAAGLAAAGVAVAGATGDDDATETPIKGSALERASAAALAHTGGGRVTATEVEDEEGSYEVEVTRDGGGQVDVHLNRDFEVLGAEGEDSDED